MQAPLAEPGVEVVPVSEPAGRPQSTPGKTWWKQPQRRAALFALLLAALAASLWLIRRKPIHPAAVVAPSSSASGASGTLRLKGTTQAVQSRAILAPLLAGKQEGTLTITSLRPAGATVKTGDLLVEFDRQAQLLDFTDKQAEAAKLEGDVQQEVAKEDAARAKDETEIRVAEDALGTAKLEIEKVELMSKIDAEKAHETLDAAKSTLEQLKATFDLKRKAAQASIRILEIQRDRSRETMAHAQSNASLMQVHSPIDGIVVLNTIWKQGSMGEVQEGDQVRPGVPFMEVVDPAAMEVEVSVNQQDVLALHEGDQARIHLDAYPDLICPGSLEVVDPMGENGSFSAKVRTFSAIFSVKCSDPRLLPGLSAAVDIVPPQVARATEHAQ